MNELERRLESRDFYELCQQYRHTQINAPAKFHAIKDYLLTGALPWPSYEQPVASDDLEAERSFASLAAQGIFITSDRKP